MKSAREVIQDTLREEPDSDERWAHVAGLHERGDEETFCAAAELLDSTDATRRALGADILGQLGAAKGVPVENRRFAGPAFELLIERIEQEADPEVLGCMAIAFGHLSDPRCISALHRLRAHHDVEVRHSVAFGLLGLEDDLAVETLLELSRDPDEHVRDWATFGLGAQLDRDDQQIRSALIARLDDPDDDTRAEAISGLAARGDERAMPRLLEELDGPMTLDVPGAIEDALLAYATLTGDERLWSHVESVRQSWAAARPGEPLPDYLREAVEACARGR